MKGRATVFVNDKKGREGAPDLNGKIVLESGDVLVIDLWKEAANTKEGFVYRGQVKPLQQRN